MSEVKRYRFKGAAGEYVYANDFDAAQSELAALREELATVNNAYRIVLETCGKAVDKMTAAEQRNAELTQALERGKLWLELFRAWFGDYGVSQEDHMAIIRTLRGLPHPPSEFDKPTESGASE